MTADLHKKLDQMVSQEAASLEKEPIHLSPYYGEAYAEVVNLAAGLDFNFIFAWGPLLLPHERIFIEVLVYLAREKARGNAFHAHLGGEQHEMGVEIYLEKVPATVLQKAREANQRVPMSLTQLTNLHRLKVYEALKSPNVHYFVTQEPARRVFVDGRVMTGPACFQVRVDPVPTPDQADEIRLRLAQRLVKERLFLMSGIQTSGAGADNIVPEIFVMSPTETSQARPNREQNDDFVMSAIETSRTSQSPSQSPDLLMSLWETSGDSKGRKQAASPVETPAHSVISAIETSVNGQPLKSVPETSVMSEIETSVMSEIETSLERVKRSQNQPTLMSEIETSATAPIQVQNTESLMSLFQTSVMSEIETSVMSEIETSGADEFESEKPNPRCLPQRRHIEVSRFLIQKPKEKPKNRNVPETRANAERSETEEMYISVKERARNLAAKHSGNLAPANAPPAPILPACLPSQPEKPQVGSPGLGPPGVGQRKSGQANYRLSASHPVSMPPEAAHRTAPGEGRIPRSAKKPGSADTAARPGQPGRTEGEGTENAERWRRETEDLARESAEALDDQRSLGFHIKVWHHARRIDRQRGSASQVTSGLFDILNDLIRRRHEADSPLPQGKAWTHRTRKWFEDNGYPLLVKADEAELEAVRAALSSELSSWSGPEA